MKPSLMEDGLPPTILPLGAPFSDGPGTAAPQKHGKPKLQNNPGPEVYNNPNSSNL